MPQTPHLSRILRIVCALTSLLTSSSAQALDPARRLTQYRIDCFGIDDGLPHGSVQALAQDHDGYLLVATLQGAVRYDGVRMRPLSEAIPARSVERLLVTPDGAIWVATSDSGLYRVDRAGHTRAWGLADGLPALQVTHLQRFDDGRIWASTARGTVQIEADDRLRLLSDIPPMLRALLVARDGTLWLGTMDGLYRQLPGQAIERMDQRYGLPDKLVWTLHLDAEQALWIGTRGGLLRIKDEQVERFGREQGFAVPATRAVLSDRDGQLWVASAGGGLHRWRAGRFETLDSLQGLASDIVWASIEDREGNLWVATAGRGICRLSDSGFSNFTRRDGLASDFVWSLWVDERDRVYVGSNGGGLDRIERGVVEQLGAPTAERAGIIQGLLGDGDNGLLLATRAGLYRYREGTFSSVDAGFEKAIGTLARDASGQLWLGGESGLARLHAGRVQPVALPTESAVPARVVRLERARGGGVWAATDQGIYSVQGGSAGRWPSTPLRNTRGVYEDERGVLWIAGATLTRVSATGSFAFGAKQGFQDGISHNVMPDGNGRVWISTNIGIYRAVLAELDDVAEGRAVSAHFERFGERDGLRSAEGNGGSPNMAHTADGHWWFSTIGGVATVHPDTLAQAPKALRTKIETLLADGAPVPRTPQAQLGPELNRVEIEFTALHLVAPKRVQFRHRLLPADPHWTAGSARLASYRGLSPGSYRFEVQSTLDPATWSGAVEHLDFLVLPHWWQTWWFRTLISLSALTLLVLLPFWRIRTLRAQEQQLSALVSERTAALAEANRELDRSARTDALTGVANRREFNEKLTTGWASGLPLTLAIIDVDHFKAYNDHHGHLQGDHCLRTVANSLAETLAVHGALTARYGGEEFAALLPDDNQARAQLRLDAARAALAALAIPHDASPGASVVTVSIGLAVRTAAHENPDALLAAADRALYCAKRAGRNRVEVGN